MLCSISITFVGSNNDTTSNPAGVAAERAEFQRCLAKEEEEKERKLELEQRQRAEDEERKLVAMRLAEQQKKKLDDIKNRAKKAADSHKHSANDIHAEGSQGVGSSLQSRVNQIRNAAKNVFSTSPRPTNVATELGPSQSNHSIQGSSPSSQVRESTKEASKAKASKKAKEGVNDLAKGKQDKKKAAQLKKFRESAMKDMLDEKKHG